MSDVPKLSGLDPFCQRSSAEIVADVGAAAVRVLTPLEFLPHYISLVAYNEFASFDGPEEAHELIATTREELIDESKELTGLMNKLSLWWVAEHPPVLDLRSTSAVEALLRWATYLVECLDVSGLTNLIPRCRFAELKRPRHSAELFRPAIWCEIAAMSRRPPPSEGLLQMWPRVDASYFASPFFDLVGTAKIQAGAELPDGWAKMSTAARIELVESTWKEHAKLTPCGPDPVPTRRPPTDDQLKILKALEGRVLKKAALAIATGIHESTLYRPGRLRELRAAKVVVNDRALGGYYRPDAPPAPSISSDKSQSGRTVQ